MNQRLRIDNQAREWVSAAEAARLLGVKHPTLYAYASRGLVRSAAAGRGDRSRVYHRSDLERLRTRSLARAGHAAVAAGALRWGEPVLETRIGSIGLQGPIYRGKAAVELARDGAAFEDVCSLLWSAPCPKTLPHDERKLGVASAPLRSLLGSRAEPFDGMIEASAALTASEPRTEPTVEMAKQRAPLLLRRLIAAAGLPLGADAVTSSLEADGTARALVLALGGRTTPRAVAAVNEALILSADHELNASTFACRVTASAGANLSACTLSALATLSGTLHGGVTAQVEAMVEEIGRPERAAAYVGARLDRGEAIPAFGHPLYPNGDPRGERLLELADRLGPKTKGVRILSAVVSAMDLVAREKPSLDVGLTAVTAALGLRAGAPIALFAAGRIAGWIAHALEQRSAGFLLRPRARYVGD